MTVVDYDILHAPPRWIFLKLETDDGLVGWGEISLSRVRRGVEGTVSEFLDEFVVGNDPDRIEHHWQAMYRDPRMRGGPVKMTAISGIDMALWDIKGKRHGLPVYEFLGGAVRDRVRLYQGIGGETTEELVAAGRTAVDDGFTMVKTTPTGRLERIDTPQTIADARTRIGALRDAVGPTIDIGLDVHGRTTKAMAKRLAVALEECDPIWYEEPLTGPEHADTLVTLSQHTTVPIATGERRFSRWQFRSLLEDGAVDVLQPDICYAGGISELRRIGAMAEAYDVQLAPHCPFGPIALAASLQIDACTPNAFVQEQGVYRDHPAYDPLAYVTDATVFGMDDDGFVPIPDGPGLGVELDEAHLAGFDLDDATWETNHWRHKDGSVAEW